MRLPPRFMANKFIYEDGLKKSKWDIEEYERKRYEESTKKSN